jgi:antitoxin component of RelBE/YafQ-DinJ toxin-antitoxin module
MATSVIVNARVPAELGELMREAAEERGISLSDLVRESLTRLAIEITQPNKSTVSVSPGGSE